MSYETVDRIDGHMSQSDIAQMERKMEEWGIDIDTIIDIVEAALKEIGK